MRQKIAALREQLRQKRGTRVLGIVLSVLFVPFIYFLVEMYNYKSVYMFFRFVYLHPGSALLGVLVVGLLVGLCYAAFRRIWAGALCGGVFFQIVGIVHFLKLALNGDPFVPWDITMAGSMGELMKFVNVDFPWWGWALPVVLSLYVLVLWLFDTRLPRGIWYRVAVAVAVPVLLVGFILGGGENFEKFGMTYMDAALQSSNYRANGFVGAFYLNIATMNVEEPEGYDQAAVEEIMAAYTDTEGRNDPDVIVILCESFWDIRKLPGTEFSADPLALFDEICARDNAYSGTLYSTAIGGGTVRTEFGVLTGLSCDYLPTGASPYIYAKRDFPTHVSYFKEQGYNTVALHPYDKKFYTRAQGYPYVGFDVFYGQGEIEEMVDVTYERGYVSDDSFADALITQLEENAASPTFLWGISMENHQTYYPLEQTPEITVTNAALNKDLLDTVTTYTQGVYHSSQALKKLVDYIDAREKDTLLVFFGDHLPTLGANYAAYQATGLFDGTDYDADTAKVMYGTPFVVYANYELESDRAKTDLEISDYNLLPLALDIGDTDRSAFMNWQLEQSRALPYYNNRLKMKNTKTVKAFKAAQQLLTYDRLVGAQYSKGSVK